jgi:hypothetical protein
MKVQRLRALSRLPADRPVYIYGTGRGARLIARALRLTTDLTVAGFVDSHQAGAVGDLPVIAYSDLERRAKDAITLIVASSYFDEIFKTIGALPLDTCFDGRAMFPLLQGFEEPLEDSLFIELFKIAEIIHDEFAAIVGPNADRQSFRVKCF